MSAKKRKIAKTEDVEGLDKETLLKKYDEVKKTATVCKDDFKTLPKTERGSALRKALKKNKRARQAEREKLREALGDEAPAKEVPKTIESTREYDETMVQENDDEVEHDEAHDEFAQYFNREVSPRVLITMSPFAKKSREITFVALLERSFSRRYNLLSPSGRANGLFQNQQLEIFKGYSGKLTAYYCLVRCGESSAHNPEIVLNNFNTRLGHSIARMFACLFPHDPKFHGRRVVTFHNQRDYIFFRHHRYEFKKEGKKAALLELGPRFTLRLKWLQKGTFDTKWGEFEWVLKIGGRASLGPLRHRLAWGEDALGPNVPVGGKMGAQENPELHTYDGVYRGTPSKGDTLVPDFVYRTTPNQNTYIDRCVTYFISALLWGWVTYHMYYHSGHIFGHYYMPYLHEFSDEELGIPPDSAPDPEYWGNHGKKYGTYR
ncbi:unnamed protein product [Nippostrongylus brasiliensis]|uniref:Probable ribosome production factor 1 (inferred by orthology to a D. melanogaster protein) n=1 Tax=Nippostrongylus brasiliensis TaxID=27835 RepID=A0A0N4YM88_NIPBR|nr:unnamed protein product [Nippostrongylus brasiliensis]